MKDAVKRPDDAGELMTGERCWILELSNDPGDADASIARARVEPGVTTEWHSLRGTWERYLIAAGRGRVELEGHEPQEVGPGDVVRIPPGVGQRIANVGEEDLVFHCICTPRFTRDCYEPRSDLGDPREPGETPPSAGAS